MSTATQEKPASRYRARQGDAMAALGTVPADWRTVAFHIAGDGEARSIAWEFPADYVHVDTIYGEADEVGPDDWTSCQLCGHPIKNDYWIQCDRLRILMRVGSECVENYSHALTPADRDRFAMAKRAHANPEEVARVQKVMAEKGWEYKKAVVAVRAWRRAETAWTKRHPAPSSELRARHQQEKDAYWKIRKAHDKKTGRALAWRYWLEHRVTEYAHPMAPLQLCWTQNRSKQIRESVARALKKKGYSTEDLANA